MKHFHRGCTGRKPLFFDSSRCPTCALNRSMGLEDAYPFAPNEAVRTQLDWIGQLIASRRTLHLKGNFT